MADPVVPFGREMRATHFSYAASYTPLNHGSYGASPAVVREHQHNLKNEAEARPDPFIRKSLPRLLNESRTAIAPLLVVPVEEVVFVPNATTGVNTVLRNLVYERGDVILSFSTAYPAVDKSIDYICETTLAKNVTVQLDYPLEDTEILQKFHHAVSEVEASNRKVKIAIFDTVITFPGVRMPWEALVEACAESKILSLIDGAHGVGHIDLTHLGKVGPDFFTSNCYKWLYTPRGCAVFHVPARNQNLIRSSLPTSHGFQSKLMTDPEARRSSSFDPKRFSDLFGFVATIDASPYMCVPKALDFRSQVCGGEETIRKHCHDIAQAGGQRIAELLGTKVMSSESGTLQNCCFVNVELPLYFAQEFDPTEAARILIWMMDQAMEKHDTHIPVKYHAGKMLARLSGQIYLELEDFDFGGRVLEELCKRVQSGEHNHPIEAGQS